MDSNDEKVLKKGTIFASSGLGVMNHVFIGSYIDVKYDKFNVIVLYFNRFKEVVTVDTFEEEQDEECFFYF